MNCLAMAACILVAWSYQTLGLLFTSVLYEPKLGSSQLGFGSSFGAKKTRLSFARQILQNSFVKLGLLYDLKKDLP